MHNFSFTTLPILFLGLILISCGSSTKESFSSANNLENKNQVPKIPLAQGLQFEKLENHKKVAARGPASISFETAKEDNKEFTTLSNKRLYFLTLNSQYEVLRKFVSEADYPAISSCPSFHTSLINYPKNKKINKTIISFGHHQLLKNQKKILDETYTSFFPELYLPMTASIQGPTVLDILKQSGPIDKNTFSKTFSRALTIHILKTKKELEELCEYGNSDNYYSYENLFLYLKKSQHSNTNIKNMKILMKTTIFSNMAVIKSLLPKQETIFSHDQNYYTAIIQRLNVKWSESYFFDFKEKQLNLDI